jgi:predicted peptidase
MFFCIALFIFFCFQEKFSVEIDSSSNVSLSETVQCALVASSEEESFSGFSPEDQNHTNQQSTSDAAQDDAKEKVKACFSINSCNLS